MGSWQIEIDRRAEKALNRMPANLRRRILAATVRLTEDPFPPGFTKLVGYENLYRIRVGDWRVLYSIEQDRLLILVVGIGPRGRIYRNV